MERTEKDGWKRDAAKMEETNEFGHGLLHKAVIHNKVKDFLK